MSMNNSAYILFIARDIQRIVITWHLICCFLQEAGLRLKYFFNWLSTYLYVGESNYSLQST
jgi:hypothetical protein